MGTILSRQRLIIASKAQEELRFSSLTSRDGSLLWGTSLRNLRWGLVGTRSDFLLNASFLGGSGLRSTTVGSSTTFLVETKAFLDLAESNLGTGTIGVTDLLSYLLPVDLGRY